MCGAARRAMATLSLSPHLSLSLTLSLSVRTPSQPCATSTRVCGDAVVRDHNQCRVRDASAPLQQLPRWRRISLPRTHPRGASLSATTRVRASPGDGAAVLSLARVAMFRQHRLPSAQCMGPGVLRFRHMLQPFAWLLALAHHKIRCDNSSAQCVCARRVSSAGLACAVRANGGCAALMPHCVCVCARALRR